MASEIKGVITPIVTPVNDDETLNKEAFKNIIDYVIGGGVHGIFVLGSTGEFYAFDKEQQSGILTTAVDIVDSRADVFAGISAITTNQCIALAKNAQAAGADAVTVLPPSFIKITDDEMYEHFKAIAGSVKIPLLLYNNPGKTANNISDSLLARLAEIDNIAGIKNTCDDFSLTIKYIDATKSSDHFSVLGGRDYYIFSTLMHGGSGCVAGISNIAPKLTVEIYSQYMAGDFAGSLESQRKLIPLKKASSLGSFPVVVKDCLNLMGIYVGSPIKPVQHCSGENLQKLESILKDLDLI